MFYTVPRRNLAHIHLNMFRLYENKSPRIHSDRMYCCILLRKFHHCSLVKYNKSIWNKGFFFVFLVFFCFTYYFFAQVSVHVCLFVCLFVWGILSNSKSLHSHGHVTIAGEGLQILTHNRQLWPLSSEGFLACHTHCDTGLPFIMVISEDPVTLRFVAKSLAAGL